MFISMLQNQSWCILRQNDSYILLNSYSYKNSFAIIMFAETNSGNKSKISESVWCLIIKEHYKSSITVCVKAPSLT